MLKKLLPGSILGQLIWVLVGSLLFLLMTLATFEYLEYDTVIETAESDFTIRRLKRMIPVVQSISLDNIEAYLERASHCHDGYTLTKTPFPGLQFTTRTEQIEIKLSKALALKRTALKIGTVKLNQSDFAYRSCEPLEMQFPFDAMVVSIMIEDGHWLNAEIHPHEWHLTPQMRDWFLRSSAAFLIIGIVAALFIRRLIEPFKRLANAANSFATNLQITELDETGPLDVRRAIRSFNMMQRQVSDEVKRRARTLATISHDIRSPLTALRVKTELIEDEVVRTDHLASIEKMEHITTSALDYLRGESLSESKRCIDLAALIESECANFQEQGADVTFTFDQTIHFSGRPNALARAIVNLIENAIKYAGHAHVQLRGDETEALIIIDDKGPGIPAEKMAEMTKPFTPLSKTQGDGQRGFGLGLAIAHAVAEGHDGTLELTQNHPTGLRATLRLFNA